MISLLLNQPLSSLVIVLGLSFLIALCLREVRLLMLIGSLVGALLGLVQWLAFDSTVAGFQFLFGLNLLPQYSLALTFGVDGLSLVFLLLTLFIMPFCFLAGWQTYKERRQFFLHLFAIELLLVLTFTAADLFYFYIFFEAILIPMFLLIGQWGSRERKIKAAYYFFLYTLFGSLVLLFGIFYIYFISGSTSLFVILDHPFTPSQQLLLWLCFFLAFAVKIPMFPVHIWLPEAHVEAPTVGSIVLASLLLKLGGYGFLRFTLPMFPEGTSAFAPFLYTLAMLGVLYGSLSTIRQIDLKRIIAYSSVAHMNLAILGLFSQQEQGIAGSIYLMVGHGVVSSALFYGVGTLYDRYHSRLLRYYGGLVMVMPLFATFFLIFSLANMGFPGTSNFLGELLIFLGLAGQNTVALVVGASGVVLSAVYSVWLYNRIAFGTLQTTYIRAFVDLNRREALIFLLFTVAMLILGLHSNFVLDLVQLFITEVTIQPATISFGLDLTLEAVLEAALKTTAAFIVTIGAYVIALVMLLIAIAYYTIAERKIMGSIQRRYGPNVVGLWGLLQPLADGLKLFAKEMLVPTHANSRIFLFAPMMILVLSLSTWAVVPFGLTECSFSTLVDMRYGLLFILALSSLNVYGIIIAGWASNSKYSFLGALRSAAQMISYEVSISLVLLPIILLAGSLNFSEIVYAQERTVWFAYPLLPALLVFFISMLAETNRTPFDLPEAEAELVAGYNVEYSSIIFAMFFLGEYSNMILMSVLSVLLFFGGWSLPVTVSFLPAPFVVAFKAIFVCFYFVLVRAAFPRYRYDQLMNIGWKIFLPTTTAFLVLLVVSLLLLDGLPCTVELHLPFLAALFVVGLMGILLSYWTSFLLSIVSIELMYLGVISSFILLGAWTSDARGPIYGLLLLILAASESAIGLGVLIASYRHGNTINLRTYHALSS